MSDKLEDTISALAAKAADAYDSGDAQRFSQAACNVANIMRVIADIPSQGMSEAQIKHMVDRFLSWKLPESFNPDGGINFKKTFNEHTDHPMKHEPVGTNLFDATQADAMVRHMLERLPTA